MFRLTVSPQEALILEMSLRGVDDEAIQNNRKMLLCIGRSLVDGLPVDLEVEYEDLWFMRDRVDPQCKVGDTTGMSLIIRIYKMFVGERGADARILEQGTGGALTVLEECNEGKGKNKNPAKNSAGGRPEAAAQSG